MTDKKKTIMLLQSSLAPTLQRAPVRSASYNIRASVKRQVKGALRNEYRGHT
jgi:hypothetical protein